MSKSRIETRGALIGTLLGDSYITNRGEFCCEQISEDLIDFKISLFKGIAPDIRIHKLNRKPRSNNFIISKHRIYKLYSNRHSYFMKLRNKLYTDSGKQVSLSVLNKITPLGIALWIMDDGYMDYKASSRTRNLRICTDSFNEDTINNIISMFKTKYDIDAKIYYHKRAKTDTPKPRVSFNAFNTQKLIALIYKYMIPSFYYKIDMHYTQDTLASIRCIPEYVIACNYISQQNTPKR